MSVDLWKQFSFGENHPDQGGGIMYALRYSLDILEAKREQIAQILDKVGGLKISELDGDGLSVDILGVQEELRESIIILLEEQSVLQAAVFYSELFQKYGWTSIADMKDMIVDGYAGLKSRGEEKVDVYNSIDMGLGQMIMEIELADAQNGVLTTRQRRQLEELKFMQSRFLHTAGSRSVIIG